MDIPIESAFDPLFQVDPRFEKYTNSTILHNIDNMSPPKSLDLTKKLIDPDNDILELKHKYDFLPRIPDILIEDFIYESNKSGQIRKDQALFKLHFLPHLSVLEKNACFFINI